MRGQTYLAIILKVCFEYILDIFRVGGVNLVPRGIEEPVGPVLAGKVSHIVVQPVEVEELVK